ncbi:MAG: response regulator [Oscillospiraceae bacterium]|nr:response regulator [Oscillospiraceae bacterium]
MSAPIHIELDALCLLLVCAIVLQSRKSFNQQMNRRLFRMVAYGIIFQLVLDILWRAIEGKIFPGAIFANRVINALYLGIGVCLACVWYLYVLETLGYKITRRIQTIIMLPGLFFLALNIISIWTGWVFTVSPENIYEHGPLFWLQTIGAYGMLLFSFAHIIVYLICHRTQKIPRYDIYKLLIFYVVTVIGAIVSLFQTGMPGTWTCAAISITLIYMNDQNREILNGMITAMAADYRSIYHVNLDKDEAVCVRATEKLYGNMQVGDTFSFRNKMAEYAEHCVAEADREAFLRFVDPDSIREKLETEAMLSIRYLSTKDGLEQYEMLRIAGVRTHEERDDNIVHSVGIGFSDVDLETRKAMEQNRALAEALEKAEEASAAKTAFLSSMSHEIRTPMNAIIGLDNIALRDPNISETTRVELEKIGSSARHLLSLINNILDMSRIESGRMVLKEEEFSSREMIEQINTIINGQCEDKGLTYESRVIGKLDEYFIGDSLRLRQVIINILGNAVKFTDRPGTVTFTAEQAEEREGIRLLRFTMKDTGVGMDKDFIPKLFEPFSQEDATTTNRYGGSGLGMAITKNIVDMMGGTITVESEIDHGTTVTVEVPLRCADHMEAPDHSEPEEPEISVAGLHVLIVEDMEMNAEILTDLLEMEEMSSDWAENGQKAVEMFEQSEPGQYDAILMDMRMPVMDGVTATKEIRKLSRADAATIPIIALTANAFEEDVQQCMQAGMNAHLSKPVEIELLKKKLARLLSPRE